MSTHSGGIQYDPLPSASEQIRILTLHAASASDPIDCSLQVVTLHDSPPEYGALSYTWGDPGITGEIFVDGRRVDVTANLEIALRHVRDHEDDITLWVDAVCINQDDLVEKSAQVAMMGSIYKKCAQVRIWLGCDPTCCNLRFENGTQKRRERSLDPFELIRTMSNGHHLHDWPCFVKSEDGESVLVYEQNQTFDDLWNGLCKVAQCTWWSRMWTVQEMLLPKAGTVMYDTWTIPLDSITKCGDLYYQWVWGCCRAACSSLPKPMARTLDAHCTTFYTIHRDRNGLADGEYFDIQDQHLGYGHRECKDPRDKVYGLLGLVGDVTDLSPWLTPDYSASVQEVYYNATCAMLYREIRDLKCLTGAEYGPAPDKWASWIRNFGATLDRSDADVGSNRIIVYDLFDASGGRKSSYEKYITWPYLPDEKRYQNALGLTGRCVGIVKSICHRSNTDLSKADDELIQEKAMYKNWIKTAGLDINSLAAGNDSSESTEQFWRTVLNGVISTGLQFDDYSDWRRLDSKALTTLQPFISWLENDEDELPFSLDRTLSISAHKRSYFRTESGSHGLCYPNGKVEDQVWVIDGSRVPFILRRVDMETDSEDQILRPIGAYGVDEEGDVCIKHDHQPNAESAGDFELIGDCYLDGYMDGEGCDDAKFPLRFVLLV